MGDSVPAIDIASLDNAVERQAKILERFKQLDANFAVYNARMRAKGVDIFHMSRPLLMQAVQSYFHDIRRLKDFHGIAIADHFKIAGFTVKWLSRLRPIQVAQFDPADDDLGERALMVNAQFAVMEALVVADIDHLKLADIIAARMDGSAKVETADLIGNLMYNCVYRDIDGNVLAQNFLALHLLAPRQPGRSERRAAVRG